MEALIGCWHLETADSALGMTEPAEIEFKPNGQMVYSINTGTKWQIMRMNYRVDGSELVTDQPSEPKEERTGFVLEESNRLVLDYGGAKASFLRGSKRAPVV
jgi:hypothetical protein